MPDDEPPLTGPERARAAEHPRYWIVWYEDRFSREDPAYLDGAFLSEEAANASAAASNQRLGPGSYEIYQVTGPHALKDETRPRDFRQLLAWLDRERAKMNFV